MRICLEGFKAKSNLFQECLTCNLCMCRKGEKITTHCSHMLLIFASGASSLGNIFFNWTQVNILQLRPSQQAPDAFNVVQNLFLMAKCEVCWKWVVLLRIFPWQYSLPTCFLSPSPAVQWNLRTLMLSREEVCRLQSQCTCCYGYICLLNIIMVLRVMHLWLPCLRQRHSSGGVDLKLDHVVLEAGNHILLWG